MRRFAHYDYWSDKVRKSILLDAKADLLVYGMGERPVLEIAARLKAGVPVNEIRDVRGTAYLVGQNEAKELKTVTTQALRKVPPTLTLPLEGGGEGGGEQLLKTTGDAVIISSFEEAACDRFKFSDATRMIHEEANPYCARTLIQFSDTRAVVQNPPSLPLTTEEMDRIYGLPYLKKQHPSYKEPVPAFETVKTSIVIHRGCFGGCAFCSLGLHQSKFIQHRSAASVLKEARNLIEDKSSAGLISDLGAPSNMYHMGEGQRSAKM